MAGYVRQSAADIVPTGVVRAAPINNELNALRDAFAAVAGHKHDGTAAEGTPVPVVGDADLLNKIATDTANNRHGVFVEVSAAAVEQVRFQDGVIVPVTDNDIDLGTSSLEFKDLYIDGTANIDSLVADTADINGGTVDATVIGATTPAAGAFTTLSASGAATLSSTLAVTGVATLGNGAVLGTPTSVTLTNATGLPISTGVSGLGSGVATFLATPSSANLISAVTDETGTGALVFATSPTLVTPILGTPTSGVATNLTGLPISTGVSGLGTGVATLLATPSSANLASAITDETGSGSLVFATSPTLVTPALGTPSSGTLTNATGLPIGTGVSGLGTGVATFLATPSSANLISAITDETGTGALVFATSPTLVTPALGTPSSGTLTNATGLPISTGVAGLGTGIATFLATPSSANLISAVTDETGTGALVFATSPTLVTPALGTPSALVGTNITGTAAGLTAGNVTTNANLTGAVTSVGNATSLGSFSSANLLAALTDETGTGSAVFATSPTLVTPILGTPTSATLTNATGLPLTTGVTGQLPVANGGTGTATPSIVAGTNVTVSGTWPNQTINSTASGTGDVVGPASSTDNAFARFDSTTGKLLQNSTGATLSDTGAAVFTGALDVLGNSTAGSNIKLYEDTDNGTNYVAFKAPDTIAADVTWTLPAADGTSAQVLSTNGTGTLSWATAGGAVTLSNDTSTATNLYPLFAAATSGTASTIYTGNAKLLYKPSTGELASSVINSTNGIVVNNQTVSVSYTIATGSSGMSSGPVTVSSGQSVTVSSGSRWVVL